MNEKQFQISMDMLERINALQAENQRLRDDCAVYRDVLERLNALYENQMQRTGATERGPLGELVQKTLRMDHPGVMIVRSPLESEAADA